ncbi:MAG: helix-turn-helix domain-containing protein [Novosphingobium sp.]
MSRTAILDAAEAIMRDEGYAAVSSRKVASVAGLKSKLVHYYFQTMDDLFAALLQRVEERHFQGLCTAIASSDPLAALWKLSIAANLPRLHKEFVALATHRERLRLDIARSAERTRSIYAAAVTRAIEDRGLDSGSFPPLALAIIMDGVARVINTDKELGTSAGHAEAIAFVEGFLASAPADEAR